MGRHRKGKRTGRKVSPICIRKDFAYFVGMDTDIDRTYGVLIDAQGTILSSTAVPAPLGRDAEGRKNDLTEVVASLKRDAGSAWHKVRGIGFADPGTVDMRTGVSSAVNIPDWRNVPILDWLQDQFRMECMVRPECAMRAYAEHLNLHAAPEESLFYLHLDWGVGGGPLSEALFRIVGRAENPSAIELP